MNGQLPNPGEFAFCTSLPPIVVEAHKSVIRDFLQTEEQIYKLTFGLFAVYKKMGIPRDPLLTKLFCDTLHQNQIIKTSLETINQLGTYAFYEYWQVAFKPSFWPNDHAYEIDNLLIHADVVQQWQSNRSDDIGAIESQLGIFRGKLAA